MIPNLRSATSARWETASFPTTCRLVQMASTTCSDPLVLIHPRALDAYCFCTQVSCPRLQGANSHHETREGTGRVGHPPAATPTARSFSGDARLRRCPIRVSGWLKITHGEILSPLIPPFLPPRYRPPASTEEAIKSADANLEYRTQPRHRASIFTHFLSLFDTDLSEISYQN